MGRNRNQRAGMTLVEIVVSMAILALALTALFSAIYQSTALNDVTLERTRAANAARAKLEEIRGTPFSEIYARYNGNPADDPGGFGTAPGLAFGVDGLEPAGHTQVGAIHMPEAGTPATLREDVRDDRLDMPEGKDLNRDGRIDANDRAHDYRILPVRIVLTWRRQSTTERYELNALITGK